MKFFRKALIGVAVAAALATSAQASMITVGGVTWDPDATGTLADNDFTARYDFVQWFTTAGDAVGNGLNAAPDSTKAISAQTISGGEVLQGVGVLTKLNNTNPSFFAGTGELTFVFGGFTAAAGPSLTGGWLKLYYDATPNFNLGAGTGGEDGSLWLSLVSDLNSFNPVLGFASAFLSSNFSAVGGDAYGNFKDANIPFYLGSDAQSAASAQFDPASGFLYAASNGTMKSNSVPEPESLALVGLGLLGLAAARRRKAVK